MGVTGWRIKNSWENHWIIEIWRFLLGIGVFVDWNFRDVLEFLGGCAMEWCGPGKNEGPWNFAATFFYPNNESRIYCLVLHPCTIILDIYTNFLISIDGFVSGVVWGYLKISCFIIMFPSRVINTLAYPTLLDNPYHVGKAMIIHS